MKYELKAIRSCYGAVSIDYIKHGDNGEREIIKNSNNLLHIKYFLKTNSCKIIFHNKTSLSDFTNIITDFTLSCKEWIIIMKI